MKKFGALMVVVTASAALAEWTPYSVNGTPYDVEIRDAGLFAIALNPAGGITVWEMEFSPAGGVTSLSGKNVANAVSAHVDSQACLTSVNSSGIYRGCTGETYTLPFPGVVRVRHGAEGSAYAASCQAGTPYLAYAADTVAVSNPYSESLPPLKPPGCPSALSTLEVGGASYGLLGRLGPVENLYLSVDGGLARFVTAPVTSVNEVALFTEDGGLRALVTGPQGLYVAAFEGDGGVGFSSVPLAPGDVTGAAFATGAGSSLRGDGFGMVISQTDAGLYRALPNPQGAGTLWVRNSRPLPPLAGPVQRVFCHGATFCVLITGQGTGDNILVYDNRYAPSFSPPPQPWLELDEGAAADTSMDAGDDDGDGIFVTWEGADAGQLFSIVPTSIDGKTVHVATTTGSPLLCGAPYTDFSATAYATDGWSQHVTSQGVTVRIHHVVRPGAPLVAPASLRVSAGAGPAVFTATPPSSGCPSSIVWTEVGDAGFTFAVNGGQLEVTVPATYCIAGGGTATYEARSVEEGTSGLQSADAGVVALTVDPWGAPSAPFPSEVTSQNSGTRETYSRSASHACDGAPGFPGVSTLWTLDAGVPGASLWQNGVPVVGPVTGDRVELQAPPCVGGGVELIAANRVEPGGPVGPSATLAVQLEAVWESIGDAGLELDGGYSAADSTVRGLATSTADCARERDLGVVLTLARADGGTVDSGRFAVPGPWTFPVPSGCTGGSFVVSGYLVEDGGTAGPSAALSLDVPALLAGIDAVTPDVLTARCGQGARGTLRATLGAASCPTAALAWRQTGGVPLRVSAGPGATEAVVESEQTGLELVGEQVSLEVTATTSGGSTATLDKTLQIVVAPFVTVRHRVDAPVASESGILGVVVRLANPEACGVSLLSFREELGGLRYVAGTARVDGEPVAVTQEGDTLVFEGLELPAGGQVELSYSARPRLLSRPQPAGQAFVKGVPVSARDVAGGLPGGGCGCAQTPGGLPLVALGLWGWMRRRRSVRGR